MYIFYIVITDALNWMITFPDMKVRQKVPFWEQLELPFSEREVCLKKILWIAL